MTRILMMEGNTADRRARAASLGVRSSSEIYTHAIKAHYPDIEIDVINGADPEAAGPLFGEARDASAYDGFVISGSSLHAYDTDFPVTNQIRLTAEAGEAGLPIFGSCWGLQISVMAAGGQVARNPEGREVGIARKIVTTEAGRTHPMFATKNTVFDAPCIHYDEVTRLPDGATLLASNTHSAVQAAVIPLGASEAWAVQYHPEFDLLQLAQLYTLYADDMITQGFFADHAALDAYAAQLRALAANPADAGLAWQLGVDEDITNDRRRRAEILNWIEAKLL
jgi:GMP synthase (glutamine-hydrolysing)